MPPQHPLTRIREVALGLGRLAAELETVLGEPPRNLAWWRNELLSAAGDLERGGATTAAERSPPRASH
jgi:hypothetical protein